MGVTTTRPLTWSGAVAGPSWLRVRLAVAAAARASCSDSRSGIGGGPRPVPDTAGTSQRPRRWPCRCVDALSAVMAVRGQHMPQSRLRRPSLLPSSAIPVSVPVAIRVFGVVAIVCVVLV